MSDSKTQAQRASQQMHEQDSCAQTLGMTILEVDEGVAKVTMTVTQDYCNGHGMCQGGIITTLADTAFAHACNACNRVTVASGLSIEFVRPGQLGDVLTATAKQQHRGKRAGVYQISVHNDKDKLIALMVGKSHEIGGAIV